MTKKNIVVKDGKKVSVVEPKENLSKEARKLQNDILLELMVSKKQLLKLTKTVEVPTPLNSAIADFVELSEIYIKNVSLIDNARKKGGRKKSDFRYSLAIEVMLEYLSEHCKGALPKSKKYPSGAYIFATTNEKINAFNAVNNTNFPPISPKTADNWLKEFKSM
jgi:hypothetical protein